MKFYTFFIYFVFLVAQSWFLLIAFQYPINGINVKLDSDGNWAVSSFDITSFATPNSLKPGDVVLTINGVDADQHPSVRRWHTVDQAHTITVLRDRQLLITESFENRNHPAIELLPFLAEACSLLIAWLLYRRVRSSKSAFYLSLVFLDIAVALMSLMASVRGDLLGKTFIFCSMIALPIVFYHFIAMFLQERDYAKLPTDSLKYFYWGIFAIFVAFISLFVPYSTAYPIYRFSTIAGLTLTAAGIFLNFLILLLTYHKHRNDNPFVALILRTVGISLFLSLTPITVLSFIPYIFFHKEWVGSYYTIWFIFVLPITFAYLIAAKKLYDIDMVLRRVLFTCMVAVVPSALFTGIIRILFPSESSWGRLAFVFMLFELSLTFILYSLEHWTTKLEPIMFPRKYRLKDALKKISRSLGTISSLREIKEVILVDIIQTLEVNGGAILFQYDDQAEWMIEGQFNQEHAERLLTDRASVPSHYTVFEITRHEEYTSYLFVSDHMNRTRLNTEEIQWLNLILTYLAVSLENIHLIRKLTVKLEQFASQIPDESVAADLAWFRKIMFDLQEKERYRIATDLHDTTMQDLFFLKGRLRSLLDKYAFTRGDRKSVEGLMDYIDIINSNLRQSCFELHPYLLKEIGLCQTIRKLLEIEALANPFEIDLSIGGSVYLEEQDLETKRHLFRLIQELINNAKKHSAASLLRISLQGHLTGIQLQYADNGVGFEPKPLRLGDFSSGGIGLEQMKSRILSLGGHYELNTAVGHGMRLSVSIPASAEGRTA